MKDNMKFSERSKGRPFTIDDGNGRTLYFNDGETEWIAPLLDHLSDDKIDNLIETIKELKDSE